MRIIFFVFLFSLMISEDAEQATAGDRISLRAEETLLGKNHDGADWSNMIVSADNRHVAYPAKSGKKWTVILDSVAGREYDRIFPAEDVMMPDGSWKTSRNIRFIHSGFGIAYHGQRDKLWYFIRDSVEIGPYDKILSPAAFSIGDHFAFIASANKESFIVKDGVSGLPYNEIDLPGIVTEGSDALVYATARESKQWMVIVDSLSGTPYGEIHDLGLCSHDNDEQKSTAFNLLHRGLVYAAKKNKAWTVVVGDQEGPLYERVSYGTPVANDTHIAYGARRDGEWYVVLDNKEIAGPYFGIVDSTMMFSQSGKLTYVAQPSASKYVFVFDGEQGPEFENIGRCVLSDDGNHYAYSEMRIGGFEGKTPSWGFVIDGVHHAKALGTSDWIAFSFSPDGSKAVYARYPRQSAFSLESKVVVATTDSSFEAMYDQIAFSPFGYLPDGRILFCAEESGKWAVYVDGKTGPLFDGLMSSFPIFTPDDKHMLYMGLEGDKWSCVIDSFNTQVDLSLTRDASLTFDSPAMFHTLTSHDDSFWLLEAELIQE
jgi:hypothetical protein